MSFDNEKFLKWPDKIFTPVGLFLWKDKWEWPAWFRRLYLLLFPVSFPTIFILKYLIVFVGIVAMAVAFAINKFYCTWHGHKGGLS